jgi:hypothetical protein
MKLDPLTARSLRDLIACSRTKRSLPGPKPEKRGRAEDRADVGERRKVIRVFDYGGRHWRKGIGEVSQPGGKEDGRIGFGKRDGRLGKTNPL